MYTYNQHSISNIMVHKAKIHVWACMSIVDVVNDLFLLAQKIEKFTFLFLWMYIILFRDDFKTQL